jgi:hypothetical protein
MSPPDVSVVLGIIGGHGRAMRAVRSLGITNMSDHTYPLPIYVLLMETGHLSCARTGDFESVLVRYQEQDLTE